MAQTTTNPATREPDIEFDPVASPGRSDDDDLRPFQRLLLNPLLALSCLMFWLSLMIEATRRARSVRLWIIPLLMLPIVLPWLIHDHCVDCGKTVRHTRRNQHLCTSVADRQRGLHALPRRWPSVGFQTWVWIYLLIIAGMFLIGGALRGH